METKAVATPVNNVQSVQTKVQSSVPKDTVSETNSFQNTLKEIDAEPVKNAETTPDNQSSEIKGQNTLEQSSGEQNNKISNVNTANVISIPEEDNINLPKASKELETLPLVINENLPIMNKELGILPQVMNETKDSREKKPLFEGKIVKDIKHKENILGKEDIFLDEGLEFVSEKHFENVQLNDEIINKAMEKSVIDKQILQNAFEQSPLKDSKIALDTLTELNSKISAINSITTKTSSKTSLGAIKVSVEDANFFSKMVENSNNNNFQTSIALNTASNQVNMAEAKAQSLQSSAAVSQALIEKLQESMNTNKAFRVDFDKDVAVIMRVDSNGVLSANFVPGSSAVEQALRNNLTELRQTLDNKGIEYNELSYTSRQQQKQKQQQRNQKGGRDE